MTSWFDDPNDTELLDLIPFFEALDKVDDVLTVLAQGSHTHNQVTVAEAPRNSGVRQPMRQQYERQEL